MEGLFNSPLSKIFLIGIVNTMKFAVGAAIFMVAIGGLFLFFHPRVLTIVPISATGEKNAASAQMADALPPIPESTSSSGIPAPAPSGIGKNYGDIEKQAPLPNPPSVVKGIYVTGWSAGSERKMDSLIALMKRTGLNAMVIDVKDYSGYVSYHTDIPEVKASGAEGEIRIVRPNALIKKLHDNGIYIIGRVTDFQDPILAKAHPEWALKNKSTGGLWADNHGLAWMDPVAQPVWDYLASIAKDAFARGFDEVNFDYIRFASDGSLENIAYPYWDEKSPRAAVVARYFKFLRATFPNNKISADLFGLATVASNDLGIGQVLENAYPYFDYVSPMMYPSHYGGGFLGYKNPALHPYEVVKYSMNKALEKRLVLEKNNSSSSRSLARVRPWLQVFDLGAAYDAGMVQKEIDAVESSFRVGAGNATSSAYSATMSGWLLWDPGNTYTAIKALSL